MNKELTCNQVSALLNFYIEGKLNPRLREYINLHLEKCPTCKKKIEELQKVLETYRMNAQNNKTKNGNNTNLEFKTNLSAYIDNELNSNENIKIKKMTISNPNARKELETMYKYRQLLQSAYKKTKDEAKIDYSKSILNELQQSNEYTTDYFYKLAGVFVILVCAIIAGFIYLYF